MPKVIAVVLVAEMKANADVVFVLAWHSIVCPAGTAVASIIVQAVTRVPVNMIVPLLSLPEMLFVVPHEERVGLVPEVTI